MASNRKRISCVVGLVAVALLALPGYGRQAAQSGAAKPAAPGPVKVVQITGLVGVKNKTKGKLAVEGGNLKFAHEQIKIELPAKSLSDVVTGSDSQRVIHGTLGTLTMFAPYGSGRFLSLFRTKLDTLTIQYHDAEDGLHGAVFTMPAGTAEMLKEQLIAQGAHTSIPAEADPAPATKGQKP